MKPSPLVTAVFSVGVGLAIGFWSGSVSSHDRDQRTFADLMDDPVHPDIEKMCKSVCQATLDEEAADARLRFAISGNRANGLPLLQQSFPLCQFDQVIVSGQKYRPDPQISGQFGRRSEIGSEARVHA